MKSKLKLFDDFSSNDDDDVKLEQNNHNHYSEEFSSEHSKNFTTFIGSINKEKSRISKQLCWEEQFATIFSISVVDTNFQSSIVKLHYGNFRLQCHILFANFSQRIFSSLKVLGVGSFGQVYEYFMDGNYYAIKVVNIKNGLTKGFSMQVYKQYFLYCLADQLEVGPQVIPIFGYDLIITQKAFIFCMQKCLPSKINQREAIENQLLKSLTVMHSVGFVHIDIKPENIAFSEKLQKHVFIDFGLSKLIKQDIGQKSLTSFSGTLRYCSQQMKKCYIIRQNMLVDLYENDKYSLKKTLQDLNISNKNLIQPKQPIFQKEKHIQVGNYELVSRFCNVLKLKFQIFKGNVQETYNLFEKCIDIPKCCCQILESKNIRKQFSTDSRISVLLKDIKQKMYQKLLVINKIDEQIYSYINEQVCLNILQNSFPIQAIIQMGKQKFKHIFTLPLWLTKIFLFINPFQSETIKEVSKKIWAQRKSLIQKIFSTFASQQQIEQSNRFPTFISLKTEFTLKFFYKKTKELNNVKILLSLRLLFIATMAKFDSKLIQNIQQQILSLITDQNQLILRVINFYLFRKLHYASFDFEHQQHNQWIQKLLSQNQNNKSSDISSKIELLSCLFRIDNEKLAEFLSFKGKNLTLVLSPSKNDERYSELINNISYHLAYLIKQKNKSLCMKQFDNTQLGIYLSFRSYFFEQTEFENKPLGDFRIIFLRFNSELFEQISIKKKHKFMSFIENFNNCILLHKIVGIEESICSLFSIAIKKQSSRILLLFDMIVKECYQQCYELSGIFNNLGCISTLLTYVQGNLREKEIETRLSVQQINYISEKLSLLLNFYKEKYSKSTNKHVFQLKVKGIQILLTLNDNKKRVALTKQFVESIFPVCYSDNEVVRALLTIFLDLKSQIFEIKGYCFEGFYIRDAFERFCDEQISNNGMMRFIDCPSFLKWHIFVKNRKKEYEISFDYFMLANETSYKRQKQKDRKNTTKILQIFNNLLIHFNQQFLLEKYNKLINNKNNLQNNFLIIFCLFQKIKGKLSRDQKVNGLKLIVMGIKYAKAYSLLQIRYCILDEAIRLGLYKNSKQRGLLDRRLGRYISQYKGQINNDWTNNNRKRICNKIDIQIKNRLYQKNNNYQCNNNNNNNNTIQIQITPTKGLKYAARGRRFYLSFQVVRIKLLF